MPFLSVADVLHGHQIANLVQGKPKLERFLSAVLPEQVPLDNAGEQMQTREDLIRDVLDGIGAATMAIRMT